MARIKLSEFRSKTFLSSNFSGIYCNNSTHLQVETLQADKNYVVKVDQGIKKRGKQGLIKLNVARDDVNNAVDELAEKGYQRFLVEPMFNHEQTQERYVSFERSRHGIDIFYSEHGGVDIEDNASSVKKYDASTVPLPSSFIDHVISVMNAEHMSFVEINPLVVIDDACTLLDAAVLVDSAGEYQASWSSADVVDPHIPTGSEQIISSLNDNSPAAFSFRVLNPNGSLWLQLMGGGASVTIADEAMNRGRADTIGSFGEYSGGPTTEEVYLYTKENVHQMLASTAQKKAFVIAGGVANFSNVESMFKGVIRAFDEMMLSIQKQEIRVFVRRGGPNEEEGLATIRDYLDKNGLLGSVHGSDSTLTIVINESLEYVDA